MLQNDRNAITMTHMHKNDQNVPCEMTGRLKIPQLFAFSDNRETQHSRIG